MDIAKAQPKKDSENLESGEGETTMEALMAQQAQVTEKLAGKQVTWVKVIQVTKDQVLVDIGEKREGVVPLSEFAALAGDDEAKAKGAPVAGQRIPVMMLGGVRRDGPAVLSYKRAKAELGWDLAVKAHGEKARVRGTVVSTIKGGFMVDVAGVAGFLPASLADLRPVRNPARMLHTGVRCYIIEVNESKKQVVLSRKAVLEEEAGKRKVKLMGELRAGEVRIGRIVHISAAGLVVDIGGVEGLVKMENVSWGIPAVPKGVERGSKLKVKVLSKPEKDGEPVGLGLKQLSPNPADALRKKYAPKSVVHGKVVEMTPEGGVRITLDGGQRAVSPAMDSDKDHVYAAGEAVSALVAGLNVTTLEVVVSINKFEEIRDRKRMAQYLKAPPPLTLGQLLSPEKPD
ncbi:MAG: S1 RNA-binding domain-containing protein [Elusimicrobiota bacterium]